MVLLNEKQHLENTIMVLGGTHILTNTDHETAFQKGWTNLHCMNVDIIIILKFLTNLINEKQYFITTLMFSPK